MYRRCKERDCRSEVFFFVHILLNVIIHSSFWTHIHHVQAWRFHAARFWWLQGSHGFAPLPPSNCWINLPPSCLRTIHFWITLHLQDNNFIQEEDIGLGDMQAADREVILILPYFLTCHICIRKFLDKFPLPSILFHFLVILIVLKFVLSQLFSFVLSPSVSWNYF